MNHDANKVHFDTMQGMPLYICWENQEIGDKREELWRVLDTAYIVSI